MGHDLQTIIDVWVLVEKDGINIAAHQMSVDLKDWQIITRICKG